MATKKVVVAGATGLVGNAALRHFGGTGCDVLALSRRRPRELYGARHIPIDLTDPGQCTRAATELQGATHLVYAAPDPKAGAAGSLIDILRHPKLNHQVEVSAGLMADEAAQYIRAFFAALRADGQRH